MPLLDDARRLIELDAMAGADAGDYQSARDSVGDVGATRGISRGCDADDPAGE